MNKKFQDKMFQPFNLIRESNSDRNNQSNWTNLFLVKRFGTQESLQNIETIASIMAIETINENTIDEIKLLGQNLTNEYKFIIDNIKEIRNYNDLIMIKEKLSLVEDSINIDIKITHLEKRITRIENILNTMAKKFSINV